MDANLIATIGLGLGTILASGLTSSIVTYRLNRNKDQHEFMRAKAEALYLAAEEYGRALGGYAFRHFPVAKGEMEWNEMLDIQIDSGTQKREHGGAETMTMLVEIYFPSTRAALAGVYKARDDFNAFVHEMKRAYKRDGALEGADWMPGMMEGTTAINASIKALEKAIVEAARSYAGVRQQ